MPRSAFIVVSRLNVAANPHPPGTYRSLFETAVRAVHVENYRASDHLFLGSFGPINEKHTVFGGQVFVYTEFDRHGDWLDTVKRNVATSNEIAKIEIPENLKPNFRKFDYVFVERGHRLYLEVRNEAGSRVAPESMAKAIQRILQRSAEETTQVKVTVEPESDALEKVLSSLKIRLLVIDVKLPNPDDDGDFEQKLFEDLRQENIGEQKLELKSLPGTDLQLNEDKRKLATVAASGNGYVEARGIDEHGSPEKVSTRDYPFTARINKNFGEDGVRKIVDFFRIHLL